MIFSRSLDLSIYRESFPKHLPTWKCSSSELRGYVYIYKYKYIYIYNPGPKSLGLYRNLLLNPLKVPSGLQPLPRIHSAGQSPSCANCIRHFAETSVCKRQQSQPVQTGRGATCQCQLPSLRTYFRNHGLNTILYIHAHIYMYIYVHIHILKIQSCIYI